MEQMENLLQSDFISKQTFEDFFKCNCNILARSSALAVARHTGDAAINPFLILGDDGIGKTSLLQAMNSEIQKVHPQKKVLYQTAHQFCTGFSDATRQNSRNNFLDIYEPLDFIMIDDFQEFRGKLQTQHALMKIFDSLLIRKMQIVLAMDKRVGVNEDFDSRLLSRICGGLTVILEIPEFEDRMKILRGKTERLNHPIGEGVLEFIAHKNDWNIRFMEGFLISVVAISIIEKKILNMELVETHYQLLTKQFGK